MSYGQRSKRRPEPMMLQRVPAPAVMHAGGTIRRTTSDVRSVRRCQTSAVGATRFPVLNRGAA